MSLEEAFRRACVMEATARKPGNVHPHASFDDLCYDDFVRSANVASSAFANAADQTVGATVLDAIRLTQAEVGKNTNLGIVLLIAPLAAVNRETKLTDGIGHVLSSLTVEDAADVYEAIRLTAPGGMGKADAQDVHEQPTVTLKAAMELAADRDSIAAEYAGGFRITLDTGVPTLMSALAKLNPHEEMLTWELAVIHLHLELMARWPDTLIARKRGIEEANRSAELARNVLDEGWPETSAGHQAFDELDGWLRAIGNKRNPGTTADLVAATLFAALRDGLMQPPTEGGENSNRLCF